MAIVGSAEAVVGSASFNGYVVDFSQGAIVAPGGHMIHLRRQTFRVLAYLARCAGSVVSRQELLDELWASKVVCEDSVSQCVREIRLALADRQQRALRTIPKFGYRLLTDQQQREQR